MAQEIDHVEVKAMEPSVSDEMDGNENSLSLPEFVDDEGTGISRDYFAANPIPVEDPTITKPSSGRISRESIKLFGEKINWLSNPLEAFADLIPTSSTTDPVALSRKEMMDKMSHHLLDGFLKGMVFYLGFRGSHERVIAENDLLKKDLEESRAKIRDLESKLEASQIMSKCIHKDHSKVYGKFVFTREEANRLTAKLSDMTNEVAM
ncbi:hypothetical protein FH972_026741 [Carpinus fangiana]|uniref:Uncharacterized protein n=1 Tax=Carpinus fangiana TaxID=176857 RepID=A0A5N6L5S7_9ROSI|nr:hypothetical protein FH972_026741 [Carpinus fangiana]